MSYITIVTGQPELSSISRKKQQEYNKFCQNIEKDTKIKFCDKDKDKKLDPGEWIEYEKDGKRIIGYSPYGNKKNRDTIFSISQKLNIPVEEIQKQIGTNINPNSFLTITLPKTNEINNKATSPKQDVTTNPIEKQPAAKVPETKTSETKAPVATVAKAPAQKTTTSAENAIEKTEENNFYTIQKGDNYWKIEKKLKLEPGTLQKLNPNLDPTKLQIGTQIRIKSSSNLSINGKSIVVSNQPYKNNIEMLNSLSKTFKNNPALLYAMMILLKTEGISKSPYKDAGYRSVGIGHLIQGKLSEEIKGAKEYLKNNGYPNVYNDISEKIEEKTTKDGKKIQVLSDKQIELLFASDLLEHYERAKKRIGKNWEKLSEEEKAAATAYTYQIYPKKFIKKLKEIANLRAAGNQEQIDKYIENAQKECNVVQGHINHAEKRFAEMLLVNKGKIHESAAEMLHNKIKETPEGMNFKTKEESLNFLWEKRLTQEERDMFTQIGCNYKGVIPKETSK